MMHFVATTFSRGLPVGFGPSAAAVFGRCLSSVGEVAGDFCPSVNLGLCFSSVGEVAGDLSLGEVAGDLSLGEVAGDLSFGEVAGDLSLDVRASTGVVALFCCKFNTFMEKLFFFSSSKNKIQ